MLGGTDTGSSVNGKKAWQFCHAWEQTESPKPYAFPFTFSNSAMNAFGPPGM